MAERKREPSWIRNAADYFDEREASIANIDEGWAKAALFFRTGQHFGHEAGSYRARNLISIGEQIDVYKSRFERGDTLSLLDAVGFCAEENVPLPGWLALAFRSAFDTFLQPGGPPSLDVVFYSASLPTNTPKKAATARQNWQLGVELYNAAWNVALSDETMLTLNAVLMAVLLQRDYGVKKTTARKLVLMLENNQNERPGKFASQSLSRFLEKRRKR